MPDEKISLLGVHISQISLQQLLSRITNTCEAGQRAVIMNVNVYAMNLAVGQPRFRQILNQADVVFCDGFGVKWGASLQGKRIQHRFTPPDWIRLLCEVCVQKNLSLYFLGARPGVAQTAAEKLCKECPGLRISGVQDGFFDKQPGSCENQAVLDRINQAHPHILIVGFGMPMQEYWVSENRLAIQANVVLPAGALFDYVAGTVTRAPRWMTDRGLEWLGRLLVEPGRLWKRYIVGNPLFFWRVLLERFGRLNLS